VEKASGAVGSAGSVAEKPSVRSSAGGPSTEREKGTSTSPSTKSSVSSGQKVNLNTATLEQLETLPGIGPVKAQAIIDARPYTSIEGVMKVKGIKEGIFGEIKDQITVK